LYSYVIFVILLSVRISRDLRDEFMRQVKEEDDSASRLVRQWIRQYVKTSSEENLFSGKSVNT